jgi:hypothetical protein
MRSDDGRKLDHKVLERMRVTAVNRILSGTPVSEVASGLGLAETTVYGWETPV